MRLLLAIHNAYTDHTSGAARSVRTIVEWLAAAGHDCRVVSTTRFDRASAPIDFAEHLARSGVAAEHIPPDSWHDGLFRYLLADVPVLAQQTRHHDSSAPDEAEARAFLRLLTAEMADLRPDIVLSYGGHPVLQIALRLARATGAATVFTLRNYGYEDMRWFEHVSSVLTNSPFLRRHYLDTIGVDSVALPSPIDLATTLWDDPATRGFVTFVNPALHKGAAMFARLADMLGRRRPDIPLLIVQSADDARTLANIEGLDLGRYPQILASPALPEPRQIFALAKILLVPSFFPEPFGRVAAEALVNGVPPIVSDRGALPETVAEGGIVLPIPGGTPEAIRAVPPEALVEPWFDAVTRLWDDADAYEAASAAARSAGARLYGEAAMRARYDAYFTEVAALAHVDSPPVET